MQDGLYYHELLKELNAFRVYEIRHPDTAALFSSPAAMERDGCSFDMKERGSIPRLLCELSEKYPERYMMLTDAFRTLFPDIEGIDARAMDLREFCGIRPASAPPFTRKERVCSVYVSDANLNQPLDISVLSSSSKSGSRRTPFTRGCCRASLMRSRSLRGTAGSLYQPTRRILLSA